MDLNNNFIGAISETEAQSWLLRQGFHVFANTKATGPADIIAWNSDTNETWVIDVKTIRKSPNGKYTNVNRVTRNKFVKYLGYCPEEASFQWI